MPSASLMPEVSAVSVSPTSTVPLIAGAPRASAFAGAPCPDALTRILIGMALDEIQLNPGSQQRMNRSAMLHPLTAPASSSAVVTRGMVRLPLPFGIATTA